MIPWVSIALEALLALAGASLIVLSFREGQEHMRYIGAVLLVLAIMSAIVVWSAARAGR